jgi:hypothetical protein
VDGNRTEIDLAGFSADMAQSSLFPTHNTQEHTMKSLWLPALLVVLAAGCTPASGGSAPAGNIAPGNTSSSDLSISSPAGAEVTLVSLSIPGMT